MPKTMKSYRMSDNALKALENLKTRNQGLSETEIIENALEIAEMIDEAWSTTQRLIGYGAFKIDNPRHKREIERTIWGID